jgi:hypothetical protein
MAVHAAVDDLSELFAFPGCPRSARVTLRLLVEEDESVLAACDRPADSLRCYVQEDDAVQRVDEVPQVQAEHCSEDDAANRAEGGRHSL